MKAGTFGPFGSRFSPTRLIKIWRLAYEQPPLIILVEPRPELSSLLFDQRPQSRRSRSCPGACMCGRGCEGNAGDRSYLVLAKPNVEGGIVLLTTVVSVVPKVAVHPIAR